VLVLSTGVIGPRLPMAKLLAGVDEAAVALSPGGGPSAAEAILTTDDGPKTAVVARDGFTVGGMAKGAGMIHPSLATMLASSRPTTRSRRRGGRVPAPAVERTFNRISVDGDCSTNDAVVLLAPARGATRPLGRAFAERSSGLRRPRPPDRRRRRGRDRRPRDRRPARVSTTRRARSRCASRPRRSSRPRLRSRPELGARARAAARRRGTAASRTSTRRSACRSTAPRCSSAARRPGSSRRSGRRCRIELDLGLGDGEAPYLASDLSYDYVRLNAEYTT
jgi:glutamate N-acetyltransferase/amino-acid N-acetyltransferase